MIFRSCKVVGDRWPVANGRWPVAGWIGVAFHFLANGMFFISKGQFSQHPDLIAHSGAPGVIGSATGYADLNRS